MGKEIKILKKKIILLFLFFTIIFINQVSALSNESIQAKEALNQVEKNIFEMIEMGIPVSRVNETYQEALQLYSAQLSLEEKKGNANYDLVIKYASDINSIKEKAIKSHDELRIFKETFEEISKETNLSEMEEEYNALIQSFDEERFEDTLKLINLGYDRVSEIQSSQTALNSFYNATSKTIKNFFANNWLKLLIIFSVTLVLLLIFKTNLKKLKMRIKFSNLHTRKKVINNLLKNTQKDYFKTRKMSEADYKIRIKKFKELIRDIDRQIMVLKEDLFKLNKKNKTSPKKRLFHILF